MTVTDSFVEHQISPAIVGAPSSKLTVSYDSGVTAELGNELTPTQVQNVPTIGYEGERDALYTLSFIDPDAPSRLDSTMGPINHWLVVNIPGNDVASGEVVTEFIGSGPPEGTGLHRYIFLLYKQQGKIDVSTEIKATKYSRDGRIKWDNDAFAAKYHLGNAIAGNFYQAQFDDYVPKLHQQLAKGHQ
uniref:Phosphatidylethanolamine-binding protein n=1 Tax=Rhabditophanes sp. KR3021 TaxID=114890 RepID=A0AC35UC03_9BILA